MKVYICGPITNNPNCEKQFNRAEMWLKLNDNKVLNPLTVNASLPLEHSEYMQVCFRLIDISDTLYVLKGWQSSKGAKAEIAYAKALGKKIRFEDKQWSLKNKTIKGEEEND